MSHTKGPWRKQGNIIFGAEIGSHVARLYTQHIAGKKSGAQEEASNAHLISAAPCMLIALEAVVKAGMIGSDVARAQDLARAAIAKAKGGAK
jgi:hypothetical protein